MTQEILISVKDLGLTYKVPRTLFSPMFVRALSGVSFDVYKGETLGVVGKNGSGKSTITKLIMGVIESASGSIALNGQDISSLSIFERSQRLLSSRRTRRRRYPSRNRKRTDDRISFPSLPLQTYSRFR